MGTVAQNQNLPVFEIPATTHEFGRDGGKFYRCYDALAEEIDEDMTKGLKEQLDGMLIFAGLFAGINTAFLALTIPQLSADPADDTNALLAQNNALLMQLVKQRNDTLPDFHLPSERFSPAHDILTINALFSVSLAFAIISSFLAVLGRQWLVCYRKRGGGGPDRQRWEQLKRFLGAKRWRLQPILDDVLPSLLQIGLIIFCASLILYLRHLHPATSLIFKIPMYVGLAFFVGFGLCTTLDRLCPFQSPLSHLLRWAVHSLVWLSQLAFGHKFYCGRREESPELLQAIALQRVIRISDDQTALLCAVANIPSIRSTIAMERLWNKPTFQHRFRELLANSHHGTLQLPGHNVTPETVESATRLYCSAAAHILLTLDCEWESFQEFGRELRHFRMTTNLIPDTLVPESSSDLIRATLGFSFICLFFDPYILTVAESKTMRDRLVGYSKATAVCSDHRCLSFYSWSILQLCTPESRWSLKFEDLREAYRGEESEFLENLNKAFNVLLDPTHRDQFDCDVMLANMLGCLGRLIADERTDSVLRLERGFKFLENGEKVLRNPQTTDAARHAARKLRINVVQFWTRKYDPKATKNEFKDKSFGGLQSYLSHLRGLDRTKLGYQDDVKVLRLFCPLIWKLLFDEVYKNNSREYQQSGGDVHRAFNAFVMAVNDFTISLSSMPPQTSHIEEILQSNSGGSQQEEPSSIKDTFTIP
ncbi:hypothetical protein M407DRAFT_19308 [Tulasnella calospora MUT 4182]|uniref:DUF6535 domain-containing protein n=1 Tax=Tulasnella calospora MUT 4182 TaxID=1051891 RepID=A0A0C3LD11_9AGAM|nr:hypothetical protein M407DRAFT_19308 [Tulasnella calospora MUT 4182]